jgi:hypothetical protein
VTELALTASQLPERYEQMIEKVTDLLPRIDASNESFYKSDSQIKTVSLNVTDLTDVGAAKHILARIERKREALKESELGLRRKRIELAQKQDELDNAFGYEADLLEIDILELSSQIESTQNYQRGAVREVTFLVHQYEAICKKLGVEVITEEMYEANESKAQVMRAFSQALAAARSRQGLIDEGNFIFFQDLGINGAAAQREVIAFLEMEQQIINNGKIPTFELQYDWLNAVSDKFCEQVALYSEYRGLVPHVEEALAQPKEINA